MEFLINVTTAQEFRPWEVSQLAACVKVDLAEAAGDTQGGQCCASTEEWSNGSRSAPRQLACSCVQISQRCKQCDLLIFTPDA